jgi:ribonuclease HI
MAAREGLKALLTHPVYSSISSTPHAIELVSDSQVTLGLANGSMNASKNVALATHLREMCVKYMVRTRWVKGHSGEPGNEMCDQLAGLGKAEAKRWILNK